MAGLPIHSIQTVTAKVQRSQSFVLANIYLEDTHVPHGVSDMINFILSQTKVPSLPSGLLIREFKLFKT